MNVHKLTTEQLLALLADLSRSSDEWMTVYLTHENVHFRHERLHFVSDTDPRLLEAASLLEADPLQREALRAGTGLVLLLSPASVLAIVPPFPVATSSITTGRPNLQPLEDSLARSRRILLVLVTWNAYVIALFEGQSTVRYKKGTGHIHAPHKKGGSSQGRFARRTQGQRAQFLRRVGGHIDTLFTAETVDRIFFGGNRLILKPLMEESRFLRDHEALISPRVLLVKRATLDALNGALADAQSVVVLLP